MLYVTHDQTEAIVLSDRIAVMSEGRILQEGPPREIYERPASQFVAGFIGNSNLIDGTIKDDLANNRWRVETPCGDLIATSAGKLAINDGVQVSLRPELIELVAQQPTDNASQTVWEVFIEGSTFLGDSTYYQVKRSNHRIRVRSGPNTNYEPGCRLYAVFAASDCACVPMDEGS
jgi:iron(III) transport system ATP-binding protein